MDQKETVEMNHDTVTVTIVDDEVNMGKMMEKVVSKLKCKTRTFTDPTKCLASFKETPSDIVITDLQMPEMDGITLLKKIKKFSPTTDVIIVSGHADKSAALDALRQGAFDLLDKPFEPIELAETIKRTVKYRSAVQERNMFAEQVSFLSKREAERWGIDAFVGRSEKTRKILHDVRLLQKAENTSVIITGESGTGKELIARAIHYGSPKSDSPFIPVNCSAMPAELAESILFGHIKGAFTGATTDKKGAFDNAHRGTLFLDEIGDMPLNIQAKLLRVLEDSIVIPVGKSTGHKVNVRIIAATNSNLNKQIEAKQFRSDLYYRLSAFNIIVPPLRERKGDIKLLIEHFAKIYADEMSLITPTFDPQLFTTLNKHNFPGNVRELKNMVERALIESGGETITQNNFHFVGPTDNGLSSDSEGNTSKQIEMPLNLKEAEVIIIDRAMKKAEGNISAAARILGISRAKLYRKLPENSASS